MKLDPLKDVKDRMLAAIREDGSIVLDGWTSQRGRKAAQEMAAAGLVTATEAASDQYTAIILRMKGAGEMKLTDAERHALMALPRNGNWVRSPRYWRSANKLVKLGLAKREVTLPLAPDRYALTQDGTALREQLEKTE